MANQMAYLKINMLRDGLADQVDILQRSRCMPERHASCLARWWRRSECIAMLRYAVHYETAWRHFVEIPSGSQRARKASSTDSRATASAPHDTTLDFQQARNDARVYRGGGTIYSAMQG